MSFVLSDAKNEILLETQTVGVRISDDDIILAIKRANQYFGSNYKMPTTERQVDLLVFNGVFEYPKPSDFIGWFEPMLPYGNASPWFVNTTANELVHTYAGNQTAFRFDRENQFLIVSTDSNLAQLVNACDSLTENGTFAISGDGSNLILDEQIFVEGSASVRFTITDSGGTTTITITGMNQVDITDYVTGGYVFASLQCPSSNTSAITNAVMRIGNNSSNYYEMSTTTNYRGDSIKNSWCQLGFNINNATETGSVTDTEIDYIQIVLTNGVSGTSGTYRLDNIFVALPTYFQLPYYSKHNVKDENGNYIANPTSLSDTILCPDDCNTAFVFKALSHLAMYNLNNSAEAQYFLQMAQPFEDTLRRKYPSQERRIQSQWYRSPRRF